MAQLRSYVGWVTAFQHPGCDRDKTALGTHKQTQQGDPKYFQEGMMGHCKEMNH